MNSPDYSQRSQRAMGFSTGTTNSNSSNASNEKACIKISLVTVQDGGDQVSSLRNPMNQRSPTSLGTSPGRAHRKSRGKRDKKICFNVGRELFVYNYDGVRTGPDASNPIYKRSYKGSSPTCHDFNQTTATVGSLSLLVGFSHGQVQLIDLNGYEDQEPCKEFNVDRLIDKTRVTCIRWLPNSPSLFLVAHASGYLYLYKDDLPSGPSTPSYQLYKQSDGLIVYTCKTKSTRNPIYKWVIGSRTGDGSITNQLGSSHSLNTNVESESYSLNEFVFSPCAKYLACASQDGFLRVYCYDTMEMIGRARSYYGGFSCVCWSPDGKYVITGGEDDLITVWSFVGRRVVARGIGHKSWVSVVAFDSYYTGYDLKNTDVDNDDDEDEEDREVDDGDLEGEDDDEDDIKHHRSDQIDGNLTEPNSMSLNLRATHNSPASNRRSSPPLSYRFGSVGQDTQLCLWDLSDDLLLQPIAKPKTNSLSNAHHAVATSLKLDSEQRDSSDSNQLSERTGADQGCSSGQTERESNSSVGVSNLGGLLSNKGSSLTKSFSLVGKRDKRNLSLRNSDKNANSKSFADTFSNSSKLIDDPTKLLGSPICPRMNEVPLLEPSVCKKISFERLTSLIFCKGGFITSCQDGYVFSWARPSRVGSLITSLLCFDQ